MWLVVATFSKPTPKPKTTQRGLSSDAGAQDPGLKLKVSEADEGMLWKGREIGKRTARCWYATSQASLQFVRLVS